MDTVSKHLEFDRVFVRGSTEQQVTSTHITHLNAYIIDMDVGQVQEQGPPYLIVLFDHVGLRWMGRQHGGVQEKLLAKNDRWQRLKVHVDLVVNGPRRLVCLPRLGQQLFYAPSSAAKQREREQ